MKNIIRVSVSIFLYLSLEICSVNAYIFSYDTHLLISEEYNDNLYQTPDNEVDDFITLISPGVRSDLRWQRTGMNVSYDFGYSMYDTYSENDSMRHNASLGGWWNITPNTDIRMMDTYVQSEDITDLDFQESGNIQRDSTIKTNTAQVDFEHRFGERRHASLGYGYRTMVNEGDETDDNQSHDVSGAFSYFFSPWLGLDTQFTYIKGLYDFSQNFDEWNGSLRLIKVVSRHLEFNAEYSHSIMTWEGTGTERDYQVYNPSLGVSYTIDEDSHLSLNAGYFVQDLKGGDNEKGLTLDGNIGKNWSFRQGSFNMIAASGYEDSQLGSENLGFTVYYSILSEFDYRMSRNVATGAGLTFRNNDYINSDPDRNDKVITATWSIDWQIKSWLQSGLEYNWTTQNSSIDENDYTENRVQVFFSWVFTERTSSRTP